MITDIGQSIFSNQGLVWERLNEFQGDEISCGFAVFLSQASVFNKISKISKIFIEIDINSNNPYLYICPTNK